MSSPSPTTSPLSNDVALLVEALTNTDSRGNYTATKDQVLRHFFSIALTTKDPLEKDLFSGLFKFFSAH